MPPPARSPGRRLVVVATGLAVLLAIAAGGLSLAKHRAQSAEQLTTLERTAERSASLVQRFLTGQTRILTLAAGQLENAADPTTVLDMLASPALGFTGGAGLADADGAITMTAASDVPLGASLDRRLLDDLEDGAGEAIGTAQQYGQRAPVLPLTAAVRISGTLEGVVVGWIALDEASRETGPFRAPGQDGFLIDADGQLLAADAPVTDLVDVSTESVVGLADDRPLPAPTVSRGIEGLGGPDQVVALADVSVCGCLLVVERPHEEVFGDLRTTLVIELLAVASLAVLGIGVAVWAGGRLDRAYHGQVHARAMAERLHGLGMALAGIDRTEQVHDVVVAELREALDPGTVRIWGNETDDPDAGPPEVDLDLWEECRASSDVVVRRTGEPGSPKLVALLPLGLGRVRGCTVVEWDGDRELLEGDIDYLRSVARQATVAVQVAGEAERDRDARHHAEQLRHALGLISRASTRAQIQQAVADAGIPAVGAASGGLLLAETITEHGIADDEPVDSGLDAAQAALAHHVLEADVVISQTPEEVAQQHPDVAERMAQVGAEVAVAAPVNASDGTSVGALVAWFARGGFKGEETLVRVAGLIAQLGQALDRAAQYDAERRIARILQQGLLEPSVPSVPGIEVLTHYEAASSSLEVGGDWYDAMLVDPGHLRVLIGDVVGHGVTAAAAMGKVRSAARALAHLPGPDTLLEHLDEFAASTNDVFMSTALAVDIDIELGRVRIAGAGHPPPLWFAADGTVELADGLGDPPLGVALGSGRHHSVGRLPSGSALLLYTDGLLERRGEPLDQGLARLVEVATQLGSPGGEEWVTDLVHRMAGDGADDDIAVVLVCACQGETDSMPT